MCQTGLGFSQDSYYKNEGMLLRTAVTVVYLPHFSLDNAIDIQLSGHPVLSAGVLAIPVSPHVARHDTGSVRPHCYASQLVVLVCTALRKGSKSKILVKCT